MWRLKAWRKGQIQCVSGVAALLLLSNCAPLGPEEVLGANFDAPSVDLARQPFFPSAAMASGVQGYVLMLCNTTAQRRLENCEVLFESRAGWGFGAAALELSSEMVIREEPSSISGQVLQPAFFCLDEVFCQRARAEVERFSRERVRRSPSTP